MAIADVLLTPRIDRHAVDPGPGDASGAAAGGFGPVHAPARTTEARSRAAKALADAPLLVEPAPLNSSKALTLRQLPTSSGSTIA